jgi:hypothetical protein
MNTAPKEEELEVSIIGPGYGECILLHVGHNGWVVVDSCINPKTKKPAALEYLKNIDVNPNWIKIIIASHWIESRYWLNTMQPISSHPWVTNSLRTCAYFGSSF